MGPVEPLLEVSGIAKRFGAVQAVDDLSFQVAPGETYGLLGPNGAGKSTAISMIAGLIEPDRGRINLGGQAMTTRSTTTRADIGLVPQEIAVYPDLTARENLRFFGRLYRIGGEDLDRRVAEVLEVIGLADRADDRSGKFSGGMKRRLNIGIGLLHRPRLLVLDEPTVGIDPQSRNSILEAVASLSAAGMAVLYTTHYMEEAERLCDRIGIVDEGRMLAEGTPKDLTRSIEEHDSLHIGATGPLEEAAASIGDIPGVRSATVVPEGIRLIADDASVVAAQAISAATALGASISSLEITQPDLEAVFLHLTGKALRN